MVFLSLPAWTRITFTKKTPDPDSFWKKRKILRMSAHFVGRKKNVYKFAVQHVRRALAKSTYLRNLKHKDLAELREARLDAACQEHGFKFNFMKESLIRSNIFLSKKVLTDLAIWEPRSFKCLTHFAWNVANKEGLNGIGRLGDPPEGVVLRPMDPKK